MAQSLHGQYFNQLAREKMRRVSIKVLMVFLLGLPLFSTSQAFAADDVNKAVESIAKLYKVDKLLNETLFGSFAATDSQTNVSPKFSDKGKKSGSSGFKIKGLKSLQYKIDPNQVLGLKESGLNYVFTIQF